MARKKLKFYDDVIEVLMVQHYNGLLERNQRHYMAIESKKIGYGGITYIANLFGSSRQRIHRGIQELEQSEKIAPIAADRQRRKGAGAPKKKRT